MVKDDKNLLAAGVRTILKMVISLLNNQSNAMCWCWKKEMVKTCQLNVDRVMLIWEMLNKEMIKTGAVLGCFLPRLVPSFRPSNPLWIAHFVLAYFFFRGFCSCPSSAEVGLTQSQAIYCFLFVNGSKCICAMSIKYFYLFCWNFFYITFAVFPNLGKSEKKRIFYSQADRKGGEQTMWLRYLNRVKLGHILWKLNLGPLFWASHSLQESRKSLGADLPPPPQGW